MTKKITDKDLENIDGGMDEITDLQQNPNLAPKPADASDTGSTGGPGGGIYDDMQQNPPDGGPETP